MTVVSHPDSAAFHAAVGGLFTDDPVRHTGVVGRLAAPMPDDAILLTVHNGPRLVGALVMPAPGVALSSGLPTEAHDEVVDHLVRNGIPLDSVRGPTDVTEHLVDRWCARTGATVTDLIPERLHRLGSLTQPAAEGSARTATEDDADLLARWHAGFAAEAGLPSTPLTSVAGADAVRRELATGRAYLLWQDGGVPAAFAKVFPPIVGMSRIGPVFTPPELRGHGYGSAATAVAARWALDRGARDVLLFADLDNPVANSIYARLGFTPVHDAVETFLARPNTL